MKRQTRNMVAEGYTGDQILDYFERSYGEYVRLEPKREGLNWVVWIAPGVAFLAGAVVVWRLSRRRAFSEPAIAAPEIPADLAPWVERVREIVRSGEAGR